MKYANVFITLCVIIIIMCGIGIGYIVYQQNPERHFRKGVAAYETGNYNEAINSLNEYLSFGFNNENTARARFYVASAIDRSRTTLGSGDAKNPEIVSDRERLTLARYLDVINQNKRDSYYVDAVIGYAHVRRRNGEYDRFIINKLEDVLHSFPESRREDDINMLLGYQFLFGGEYNKAMKSFLLSSSQLSKLGQAETHFAMKQFESGFKIYEDFINFFPTSPFMVHIRNDYTAKVLDYAELFMKNGKNIQAIPFYNRVVTHFPDSPEAEKALFHIGQCYYNLRNFEQAKSFFMRAFEHSAGVLNDAALFNVGLSSYEMAKHVEAYKYFNLLINQYPGSIYNSRARQWVVQIKKDLEYFND